MPGVFIGIVIGICLSAINNTIGACVMWITDTCIERYARDHIYTYLDTMDEYLYTYFADEDENKDEDT